jgi:hypothetical protein
MKLVQRCSSSAMDWNIPSRRSQIWSLLLTNSSPSPNKLTTTVLPIKKSNDTKTHRYYLVLATYEKSHLFACIKKNREITMYSYTTRGKLLNVNRPASQINLQPLIVTLIWIYFNMWPFFISICLCVGRSCSIF